jgi:hypothetical protein
MSKHLFLATTIALSSAVMPLATYADNNASTSTTTTNPTATTPTTGTSTTEMSKDAWLSAMTPMLPGLICKGFMDNADLKKQFDTLKITEADCEKMIPESTTICQNQIYADIPASINDESAGKWGRTLGECIGKDFAQKHLMPH